MSTGLVYRAGRGDDASFRVADATDFAFDDQVRSEASAYLVWLFVYRHGPVSRERLAELARLPEKVCQDALEELIREGRVREVREGSKVHYESDLLVVAPGSARGYEAAILDHFQAMITAMTRKLVSNQSGERRTDEVGGSTWSLDVWPGHPLEAEAKGTLRRIRAEMEELRARIDSHNSTAKQSRPLEKVVVYSGQYVASDGDEQDT